MLEPLLDYERPKVSASSTAEVVCLAGSAAMAGLELVGVALVRLLPTAALEKTLLGGIVAWACIIGPAIMCYFLGFLAAQRVWRRRAERGAEARRARLRGIAAVAVAMLGMGFVLACSLLQLEM